MMRIAAVVVTYNRLELLKNCISHLQKQTVPCDILVVNNHSTDGTEAWLESFADGETLRWQDTGANIGGAGGFYTGTKTAFEAGADYIVLMDDDGRAADEYTFERLFRAAERLHAENPRLFVNSLVRQGEWLSFKLKNRSTVAEALADARDGLLYDVASPFNGTLVSRELVAQIGYPNPDFFIKGDEVDYKERSFEAGATVVTVVDSDYIHPRTEMGDCTVFGWPFPFFVEAPWKEYYTARNFTYIYRRKGWYRSIAVELIYVKLKAVLSMECDKAAVVKMLFKGILDGWRGRLGPTVKP